MLKVLRSGVVYLLIISNTSVHALTLIPDEAYSDIRYLFRRETYNFGPITPENIARFVLEAPYNLFCATFILPIYFEPHPEGGYHCVWPPQQEDDAVEFLSTTPIPAAG